MTKHMRNKKRKIKKRNITILFILIILVIGIYLIFANPFLSIKLIGDSEINIEVGSIYNDKGVKATYFGKDVNSDVTKTSISTSKAGKQVIEYKIKKLLTIKTVKRTVIINDVVKEEIPTDNTGLEGYNNIIKGPKYINGVLIVNKKYSLPENYGDGVDDTAYQALEDLQAGAKASGFSIPLISGYRSYETQVGLYQRYVNRDGKELADTYSARPGHSEHQTGLAFDVGLIDDEYGETPEGKWLAQNCAEYGFILRYQKGKEHITGYQYEPWHIRYVGVDIAKEIMRKGITLEEYLKIA